MAIAVKAEVLREMMKNKKWNERLEKAETLKDFEWVVLEYCKEKKLRVVDLNKER